MISCVKSLPEFYQDVIISYNKSKVINYEDFCNNVLNQPIWGNNFIKFKNKTLFFKNWIAEGIVSVNNLKIRNGVLDIAYLNDIVKDKRNFHIEINMLNSALRATKILSFQMNQCKTQQYQFTFITLMKCTPGLIEDINITMTTS